VSRYFRDKKNSEKVARNTGTVSARTPPPQNYATMMMTGGVSLAHSVGYLCQGHIVVDSKDFILFQPIERFYSFSTGERRRRDLFTC
jgi:hypothetical protein